MQATVEVGQTWEWDGDPRWRGRIKSGPFALFDDMVMLVEFAGVDALLAVSAQAFERPNVVLVNPAGEEGTSDE